MERLALQRTVSVTAAAAGLPRAVQRRDCTSDSLTPQAASGMIGRTERRRAPDRSRPNPIILTQTVRRHKHTTMRMLLCIEKTVTVGISLTWM